MGGHFNLIMKAGDFLSIGVVLGTLVTWLPSIAAAFSIFWVCVRLYDRHQDRKRRDSQGDRNG